jgi:hypothetical protein
MVLRNFVLKMAPEETRIWPWLACVFQVRHARSPTDAVSTPLQHTTTLPRSKQTAPLQDPTVALSRSYGGLRRRAVLMSEVSLQVVPIHSLGGLADMAALLVVEKATRRGGRGGSMALGCTGAPRT